MDWAEIGTQVILGIVGAVISGLGILITYLINKYIKNDKLKTILNSLNELVRNSVLEIQQTYVDSLKKGGMFDEEAQKEALARCLDVINTNMPKDVKEWLDANVGDVEAYLKGLIEAQIGSMRIGGK
jgi:hypothetical protein